MPAQQRLGRDEKTASALMRKRAARCGEEGTVGGSQAGTLDLSAHDLELLAQDDHLDVLGAIGASAPQEQLQKRNEG
jgi:hypothetical protein